ncbi:MAG: hypothetical protein AVDCRST_MAG40-3092, partial [uncultured Gemmatimonadaceae bacterium]
AGEARGLGGGGRARRRVGVAGRRVRHHGPVPPARAARGAARGGGLARAARRLVARVQAGAADGRRAAGAHRARGVRDGAWRTRA